MIAKPMPATAAQRYADYQKKKIAAKIATQPNQYNGYVLDQLYIIRTSNIKQFTTRSICFLGYNPYQDGLYTFNDSDDERKFMNYWLNGPRC